MKVSQLSLEELYSKPKITPSVEKEILIRSDFSSIDERYCDKVCKLKCKKPEAVKLLGASSQCDVLFIQDHYLLPGKWDRRPNQQEEILGSVIEYLARKAGMNGLSYRITSLLKCPTNDKDFAKGKAPIATTLLKCKPYLWEEIKNINPKVIVSFGTAATKALGFKQLGNGRNRGQITSLHQGDLAETLPDIPVVVSAHPRILSMIRQNAQGSGMWGSDYFDVIQRDFEKAAKLARGQLTVKDLKTSIEFFRDNRITFCKSEQDVIDAMATLNSLPANFVVSFDTETNGLDPLAVDAKLLTIQFGYRDPVTKLSRAIVIPLWHRKNDFYDPTAVWHLIAQFLEGPRPKVAHNGKFDILMIYWTTGARVKNMKFDTMLLLHSISSGNQGCYGLKAATWDYLYDLGVAGYEDLLPKLKDVELEEDEEATA